MKDERKNTVTVNIHGQQYKIRGHESAQHIQSIAQYVDQKMRGIVAKNPTLDTAKAAVLTAVNITDEYYKLKKEYDELIKLLDDQTKE